MGKWHDSTANELPYWVRGQCITLLYFRLLIIILRVFSYLFFPFLFFPQHSHYKSLNFKFLQRSLTNSCLIRKVMKRQQNKEVLVLNNNVSIGSLREQRSVTAHVLQWHFLLSSVPIVLFFSEFPKSSLCRRSSHCRMVHI